MPIEPIAPGGGGELPPERRKGLPERKKQSSVRKRVEKQLEKTTEEIRNKIKEPGKGENLDEEA